MGKSVYSIVLSDEVVQAIDDLAYRLGTSRSRLVDRILAERVSCVTPEMRMCEFKEMLEQKLPSGFLAAPQTSDSVIALKRALRFKYNPTMYYTIELSDNFSDYVGMLKISVRTRSQRLIELCDAFFRYWSLLELREYGGRCPDDTGELYKNGLIKTFLIGDELLTNDDIAGSYAAYMTAFDKALTCWFSCSDNEAAARENAEKIYREYEQNKSGKIL